MRKNFLCLVPFGSSVVDLTKDPCSYAYALAKYHGWKSSYAYVGEKIQAPAFERYCRLIHLGRDTEKYAARRSAVKFLSEHVAEYDALMFFNYGSTTYKLARIAREQNPSIVVYCKMDMSEGGFLHWGGDDSFAGILRNLRERVMSRNVDLFSVETKFYYEKLKDKFALRHCLAYLPNGASLYEIDTEKLAQIPKENIILTVGRLGTHQKHTELLIEAAALLPEELLRQWKIYLVGPKEKALDAYLKKMCAAHPFLEQCIVCIGATQDRQKLYGFYSRAKIFALPSRWESFGIVTVEAMHCGCYPVLTDYGPVAYDQTDQGRFGCVVKEHTPQAFAETLQKAMCMEQYPVAEIKEYADTRFSYQEITGELDQYLQRIRGGKV